MYDGNPRLFCFKINIGHYLFLFVFEYMADAVERSTHPSRSISKGTGGSGGSVVYDMGCYSIVQ